MQIEVRKYDGDEVVHSIDVAGKSERQIERIEDGMNINLNHEEFYTIVTGDE